jgi:hypothetical protein
MRDPYAGAPARKEVPMGFGPRVLVGPRGSGKSMALVRWQAQGHAMDSWPTWSRVILVGSTPREQALVKMVREYPTDYLGRWCDSTSPEKRDVLAARSRAVITYSLGNPALRWLWPEMKYEYAVDDADEVLANFLGLPTPAQLTITGQVEVL